MATQRIRRSTREHRDAEKRPRGARLRPENQAALEFLREWMSTPDEMGDEWWEQFEKDLRANRLSFDRTA